MYKYILVCTYTCLDVQTKNGMYWYVLVCTDHVTGFQGKHRDAAMLEEPGPGSAHPVLCWLPTKLAEWIGPCRAADMGVLEIQVEALPCDVMAGGGGTAGPAQEIRHQPPNDSSLKQCTVTIYIPQKTTAKH